MVLQFIKWEILKIVRSTTYVRSILGGIFLAGFALLLLFYVLLLGMFLQPIIVELLGQEDPVLFLNSSLVFYFLVEIIYRYFVQRLPVFELESFLHLPIPRSGIIHYLLIRSFISPLTLIPFLLFFPFALTEIAANYGMGAAVVWISCVLLTSWSLHWGMLWFKQRFEDSLVGIFLIFLLLLLSSGSTYFGLYDLGAFFEPVFTFALISAVPLILLLTVFICTYFLAFAYYKQNAYLEDLAEEEDIRFVNKSLGLFFRFGLAGEMADLEWKLIIRHKKSRTYLLLCGIFLLYGLIFYNNPTYQSEEGFNYMFIFVGSFITGIFMLQYGQLFLSWNSANFDFFLRKEGGVEALIKGKYLLFMVISCLCFVLSVPYAYFGWDFLLIHLATFLFNMGVTVHLVVLMAIWKPKPMDLSKGGMFNYEGLGIAQFLMIIPLMVAPYAVFLPFALWINDYAGLLALGVGGVVGMFAFPKLSQFAVNKVINSRYEISSAFRQEL
jgi:hypothetical protein